MLGIVNLMIGSSRCESSGQLLFALDTGHLHRGRARQFRPRNRALDRLPGEGILVERDEYIHRCRFAAVREGRAGLDHPAVLVARPDRFPETAVALEHPRPQTSGWIFADEMRPRRDDLAIALQRKATTEEGLVFIPGVANTSLGLVILRHPLADHPLDILQ